MKRTCYNCEFCIINPQHDDMDDCVKRIKNKHKVQASYKTGKITCPVHKPVIQAMR